MDDVNYLLFRRQLSRARAEAAASPESRAAHEGLVQLYTDQVRAVRERNELIAQKVRLA